jgi:hypothetical protein
MCAGFHPDRSSAGRHAGRRRTCREWPGRTGSIPTERREACAGTGLLTHDRRERVSSCGEPVVRIRHDKHGMNRLLIPGPAPLRRSQRTACQYSLRPRTGLAWLSGATPIRCRSTDPPERDQLLRAFPGHRQPLQLHREDGGVPTAPDVAATCRPARSPRSDNCPPDGRLFGVPPNAVPRRMQ